MSASIRSPLFILGIGATAALAGVRSPAAFWVGGAAGVAAEKASVRSLVAFWMGGAFAHTSFVPPQPPIPPILGGRGKRRYELNRQIQQEKDDRDLLEIASILINIL